MIVFMACFPQACLPLMRLFRSASQLVEPGAVSIFSATGAYWGCGSSRVWHYFDLPCTTKHQNKGILSQPYPLCDFSESAEVLTEVSLFLSALCFLMKSIGITQQAINSPKINHKNVFSISVSGWLTLEFRLVFSQARTGTSI